MVVVVSVVVCAWCVRGVCAACVCECGERRKGGGKRAWSCRGGRPGVCVWGEGGGGDVVIIYHRWSTNDQHQHRL